MTRPEQHRGSGFARLAGIAGLLIVLLAAIAAQAQTFTTLHSFTGGSDGAIPEAGLTMDAAGNLYGTTANGGHTGCFSSCGTVFKLKHEASGWILNPLYAFSGSDGANPEARVIVGPDGNLYGTTAYGGTADQGTVFKLSPPPSACKAFLCPWTETVLYSFQGDSDGEQPQYGDLVFDHQGNIYGTTPYGGAGSGCYPTCGVVYELSPSHGGWTESILYRFQGGNDGGEPFAGLIFDAAGNLYGTAEYGGANYQGVVYKLSPSENGWTESVIYTFTFGQPYGGLIFDQAGNLYGVTSEGEEPFVYELTPSGGAWTFNQLYQFSNTYLGSLAKLTMDPAGNLYGTLADGDAKVFRLTLSDGQWTQTGFNGGAGDAPYGNVILDASGNVYTTASGGGTHGYGVVFEITP
ncbi:MAG: choice-of-anchor tandem repeat GloVer-containing protein [Candidatus Korobacteraceae bacterium]|jgi:uncharacterized repeat protein (TIGR03803 family)